jgi:hypothetical protein
MIDFNDPKWRMEERVQNILQRHGKNLNFDRAEAERMVKYVIETKEQPCTNAEISDSPTA